MELSSTDLAMGIILYEILHGKDAPERTARSCSPRSWPDLKWPGFDLTSLF